MPAPTGPVDRESELALHEQIERRLRASIQAGALAPGEALPSTRELAATLGVSRGVVTEAYGQLASEGYLAIRQGAPVRVAAAVQRQRPLEPVRSLLETFAYDLRPGVPDLAGFPTDAWLRSARAAARGAPFAALGETDPRGAPELRETLAIHLARSRGAAADPEHTIVCGGFRAAFTALCRGLANQGVESVAVEDPGWHPHRLAIEAAGLRVEPIPVDAEGIVVERLTAPVVVVTPSHQFPTGAVLSAARRAALVEWATANDALIVEDDYDAELSEQRPGVLQGLAPERVLLIGSAAKRLAPGLRLGWMLSPSWLTWPLTTMRLIEPAAADVLTQLTLRDFVARGELERHLRRMRARYASRRATLVAALSRLPVRIRPAPPAGLFLLAEGEFDEGALLTRAADAGVGVEPLGLHRFEPGSAGLVLGYAALPEPALQRAVELLAGVWSQG